VTAEKRRGHFCVAVRTSTASSAAISTCSIRAAVGSLALRGGATTYPHPPMWIRVSQAFLSTVKSEPGVSLNGQK
jgi:hypothetical protein